MAKKEATEESEDQEIAQEPVDVEVDDIEGDEDVPASDPGLEIDDTEVVGSDEEDDEADLTPETEEDELETARSESKEAQDRLMRLAAEFDNYKKRTSREIGQLVKNAGESVILKLLPTLDNIERALQAPQTSDETKSFAEGIVMIHQQLLETLAKDGLEVLEAVGQSFDPNLHEAIMAVEQEDTSEQTILEEVERGYRLNEKILRPAKVVVSK